jgi:hypothetical protein
VSRIDLDVPFLQKERAKSLGAKWDQNKKSGIYQRGLILPYSRNG